MPRLAMGHRRLGLGGGGGLAYWQTVKALFGANLIGYWPLDDISGTSARDLGGNSLDGSYVGAATLTNATGPSGKSVAYVNGTGPRVDFASTAIKNAWGANCKAEGGMGGWFKADNGVWADNTARVLMQWWLDSSNVLYLNKTPDNTLSLSFTRGGVSASKTIGHYIPNNFFHAFVTWSEANNRVRLYLNGEKVYEGATGTWSGAAPDMRVFSDGGSPWKGWGDSMVLLGGQEPTQSDVGVLCSATKIYRISLLGDSITNRWPTLDDWGNKVTYGYRTAINVNHAAPSMGVLQGASNMAAQVAAAATDNADIIIIALGVNDNNAGDMVALQAAYESGIDTLRTTNPSATIYAANAWPLWTGGIADNIRAAIAAACAVKGVTCWDTSTDPWFLDADTSDHLHPTAAGNAKIAARVLALLP